MQELKWFSPAGGKCLPCRVADGYVDSGRMGSYFGKVFIGSRWWAIVQFDDDEDPDLYKAESILVAEVKTKWSAV